MAERIVRARLVRRDQDTAEFDRQFWREIGPQGRFDAAWQMTQEVAAIRPKDGPLAAGRGGQLGQSRLQRHVEAVRRRGG